MQIESIGHRRVLLTSAELQCFKVARTYQRKVLVRRLLNSDLKAVGSGFTRLGWSKNPIVLSAQWAILILAAPLLLIWLIVRFLWLVLVFPIRYLQTFFVPKDLTAPGEKTLVGIYNAFNRYFNLDATAYIACLNDWIRILYGDELLRKYNVSDFLTQEMQRLGLESLSDDQTRQFTPKLRPLLSASREKISKQLGHYLVQKKAS